MHIIRPSYHKQPQLVHDERLGAQVGRVVGELPAKVLELGIEAGLLVGGGPRQVPLNQTG